MLLSYYNSKFILTTLKTVTNFKNYFRNLLQNAWSGFLWAACDFKNCYSKLLMTSFLNTDSEAGYWKPFQAFWSGLQKPI